MGNRVELDLTSENNDRYVVLVTALQEYAAALEHQADDTEQSDVENGREPGSPQVLGFRASSAIAQQLMNEVEQQLDAGPSTSELSTEETLRLT